MVRPFRLSMDVGSSPILPDLAPGSIVESWIRQGVQTLSEPTKKLRELILQGAIVFEEKPYLLWCFSKAVEVTDNNGKLSKKHKDDSQRIDLLSAVINSLVRTLNEEEDVNQYIQSEAFVLQKIHYLMSIGNADVFTDYWRLIHDQVEQQRNYHVVFLDLEGYSDSSSIKTLSESQ